MPRSSSLLRGLLAAALAATFASASTSAAASARTSAEAHVVLVHGAFADASGFGSVTARLQDRGYTVIAPANPLRGPASDAAYVASVMKTMTDRSCSSQLLRRCGDHGGGHPVSNVKALVYLNALALDEGESTSTSSTLPGTSS